MQTNLPSSGILRRQNDRDRDRDPDRDRDSGRQADRDNGRDRQNDNGRDRDGGNNNANVNVNNNDNGRNGANRVDNNNRGSGLGNAAALLAANNAANRINPLAAAAALRPPLRPLPGNFGGPGLGTPAGLGLGGIGGIGANDGLRPLPGFSVPPPGASLVPLPGAASSPVVDPAVAAPPPVAVPGAAAGDAGSVQPGLASGGQGVAVVPLTTPAAVAATPAVATPPAAAPTVGGPSVFASDVPPVLVSPDPLPTTVLQQPPVDTLAPVPVPTMAVPVDIPPVAIPADLGPGGVPGGTQTTDMSPLFSPATGMPASSDGPASLSAGAAAGIALGSIGECLPTMPLPTPKLSPLITNEPSSCRGSLVSCCFRLPPA